jgi:hypothetical protein
MFCKQKKTGIHLPDALRFSASAAANAPPETGTARIARAARSTRHCIRKEDALNIASCVPENGIDFSIGNMAKYKYFLKKNVLDAAAACYRF